jgi:cell division protein FtsL
MKRSPFILIVIGVNLFFVFFLVYKNSRIVQLSFQKQQHEKTKTALLKERDRLQQQLCVVQNRTAIKQFAKDELKMEKITSRQIKSLPET